MQSLRKGGNAHWQLYVNNPTLLNEGQATFVKGTHQTQPVPGLMITCQAQAILSENEIH